MKSLIAMITLLSMISIPAFAKTIEGVEPELNFDETYESHNMKLGAKFLTFVLEGWTFPSRSSLGKRQKKKFEKALEIMEEVMNSEEFRTLVISYQRQIAIDPKTGRAIMERSYQKPYLWNNRHLEMTNEEVYDVLMRGNERMTPDTEGEMNFNSYVKVCNWVQRRFSIWCRKVIGSTNPHKSKMIKLNWKFYSKFETHEMVSNMVHEWIHLLGFLHGNDRMKEEVPYVVGGIAGRVAKKILEERK